MRDLIPGMKNKKKRPVPTIEHFAIVIGAMKSGTSTLFEYLSQHPQIAKARRKELKFFSSEDWEKGREFYFSRWPNFNPAVHRYALEASPRYTKDPRVPARIKEFGGNFHFIYIVRNPVDRIESQIAHNIAKGRLAFDIGFDHDFIDYAVQGSQYARALDDFRAGIGNPKILILDFNEFCRTPFAVTERCVEFLGLDPSFRFCPIKPRNVRKSANRANEFRLDADQRAELARRLLPDIREFRDRYGFDVSSWGLL